MSISTPYIPHIISLDILILIRLVSPKKNQSSAIRTRTLRVLNPARNDLYDCDIFLNTISIFFLWSQTSYIYIVLGCQASTMWG